MSLDFVSQRQPNSSLRDVEQVVRGNEPKIFEDNYLSTVFNITEYHEYLGFVPKDSAQVGSIEFRSQKFFRFARPTTLSPTTVELLTSSNDCLYIS